jgi:hypothetical protein
MYFAGQSGGVGIELVELEASRFASALDWVTFSGIVTPAFGVMNAVLLPGDGLGGGGGGGVGSDAFGLFFGQAWSPLRLGSFLSRGGDLLGLSSRSLFSFSSEARSMALRWLSL